MVKKTIPTKTTPPLKDFLRRRMGDLGLSSKDLAKAMGVTRMSIYHIRAGVTKTFARKKLSQWAEVLQVSLDEVKQFYTPSQRIKKKRNKKEYDFLRQARCDKKMTQRELATCMGVSQPIITRLELGEKPPVPACFSRGYAELLGLDVCAVDMWVRTERKKRSLKKKLSGDPLGNFFRKARLGMKLTQDEAAKKIRFPVSHLSNIECGRISKLRQCTIRRLEEFYKCSVPETLL